MVIQVFLAHQVISKECRQTMFVTFEVPAMPSQILGGYERACMPVPHIADPVLLPLLWICPTKGYCKPSL
jgi:hypothetical protein